MILTADADTVVLLVILIAIFAFLFGYRFYMSFREFRKTLRNINLEIARTAGSERRYWRREKRRLWLEILFPNHR